MNQGELIDKWNTYVYRADRRAARRLIDEFPERRHLRVDYGRLGVDYEFTNPLLSEPDATLGAGREALRRFAAEEGVEPPADDPFETVYLRIANLPESRQMPLAELRAEHIGELVSFSGCVAEVGPVRPKLIRAAFRCEICDAITGYVTQPGHEMRDVPGCPDCRNVGFVNFVPERSEYVDTRVVEIEPPDGGERRSVWLEHDLVGAVASEESVRVAGIPRARSNGDSTVFDLDVEAVSVDANSG